GRARSSALGSERARSVSGASSRSRRPPTRLLPTLPWRPGQGPGTASSGVHLREWLVLVARTEEGRRQLDATLLELVEEVRTKSRRPELAEHRSVLQNALDLEFVELLERDHLRLHALDLGDRDDATSAVLEPLELDDQVERRSDLLTDRADRQVEPGHHHHRLDSRERVSRRVGVHRRQGAFVAR